MNPRSFGLRKRLGVCFQKVDFPAYVKVKSICKLIASQYGLKHWDHPGFYHLFGMHELTNLEANSLSGGEKKRLMLYLSYFHEPDLIILDEPTAALDSKYQNIFRDYLRSSKDQKRLTIMSSHMDEDLQSGIDVVLKLSRGKITKEIISKDSEQSRNRHVIFDAVDGYPYHQHPEIELIGGKAHIHTDHAEDLFRKLSQANTPLPNLSVSRSKKPTSEVRP